MKLSKKQTEIKPTKKNKIKLQTEINLISEIIENLELDRKKNKRSVTKKTIEKLNSLKLTKQILGLKIENYLLDKREHKLKQI